LAQTHLCSSIIRVNVAAGTYKPTKNPFDNGVEMATGDARDVTFHPRDGVAVYGGYAAGGSLTQNVAANVAILSGGFVGNDMTAGSGSALTITNNADNAYHVALASAASSGGVGVTIDGFSIAGGNADAFTTLAVKGNSIQSVYGVGIFAIHSRMSAMPSRCTSWRPVSGILKSGSIVANRFYKMGESGLPGTMS